MNMKEKVGKFFVKNEKVFSKIGKILDGLTVLTTIFVYIVSDKTKTFISIPAPVLFIASFGLGRVISHSLENILGLREKKGELRGFIRATTENQKTFNKMLLPQIRKIEQENADLRLLVAKLGGDNTTISNKTETPQTILKRFLKGGEKI